MHMGYSPRYDHMVGHKTSLNILNKIEIKVFFLSNPKCNETRDRTRQTGKSANILKLNAFLNND